MILFLCRIIYAEILIISTCKTNKNDGVTICNKDIFLNNGQTNLVRIVYSNGFKDGKTNVINHIFYYNNTKVAKYHDFHFHNTDDVGISTYQGTPYSVFIELSRDGRLEGIGTGVLLDPMNALGFDYVNGTFVPRLTPTPSPNSGSEK